MNCSKLLTILAGFLVATGTAVATPVHLRCEYRQNPLGIDSASPQLSWQSDSTERNWKQTAYQVLVATRTDRLQPGRTDVWDSGKTDTDDSLGILYKGPQLQARQRYYWKVRVWDSFGHVADSTENAWWEMGLLHPEDWKAKWISWNNPQDELDRKNIRWIWVKGQDAFAVVPNSVARFRLRFHLKHIPREGALLLATRGTYDVRVNGQFVGSKRNWTAFERQDITGELKPGSNLIDITVTAPDADTKTTAAAFAALVKIIQKNGSITRLPTGRNWQAAPESGSGWHTAMVVADLNSNQLGNSGPLPQPAACFRRTFQLTKSVDRVRFYVSALGSYRIYVNGSRVGNDVLTPEFTDYRKRVFYQIYDVTSLLASGKNEISALVGDGWYGSPLTWAGVHFFTPPDRLLAQLEITYTDGTRESVSSDNSWKASASPILASQIYGGEIYDARLEKPGWQQVDFDDSHWTPASIVGAPPILLSSQIDSPVRIIHNLRPANVTSLANGTYIFDMAQNMVGWVTLKATGAAGTRIRLRFAERLNSDGSIYTANLRNADATDTYVLKGGGEETFAPHFTFHGFRYVEITGYPGVPSLDAIQGDVVSSVADEPAATLITSSDLVNRMWGIGLWGQKGNFLSIPTDCPQRDERLGWMGDAEVFWRTGSYNFDIAAFSHKFIQDMVDAQTRQGAFTNVSPNTLPVIEGETEGSPIWNNQMIGAPGWGDAGVIVPWTTWVQYGDKEIVEQNWDAMQHWMEFVQSRNPDFIRRNGLGPNYADWLAPDPNTDRDLLATAYWALIAKMMSEMAHAIGRESDVQRYDQLLQNIRTAFEKTYIKSDGTVGTGTQTSYVVALYTGLAPRELEPVLVGKLVDDIQARNWHLSTGFLGTPFLLFTLADHGRSDVAYRLLLNETYPSWGYMLSKGATTWWERWNGDTGDPSMNSYNHYAFGSVMAWVYRYVAGIDTAPASPGFKEIVIHPHLDSRMTSAHAEYNSVYGKIVSDWEGTAAGPFSIRVTIPANTSANIYLPAIAGARVSESGTLIEVEFENGLALVRVGSGNYQFQVH